MNQSIAVLTLVVRDYDEAIAWYVHKLGFEVLEDTAMGGDIDTAKRWVRIAPRGSTGTALLLAEARGDAQVAAVGNQSGGRVFLFLHTDDFDRDFASMSAAGVRFLETPRDEPYGKVVVFEDLYGNRWDFIEPKAA